MQNPSFLKNNFWDTIAQCVAYSKPSSSVFPAILYAEATCQRGPLEIMVWWGLPIRYLSISQTIPGGSWPSSRGSPSASDHSSRSTFRRFSEVNSAEAKIPTRFRWF